MGRPAFALLNSSAWSNDAGGPATASQRRFRTRGLKAKAGVTEAGVAQGWPSPRKREWSEPLRRGRSNRASASLGSVGRANERRRSKASLNNGSRSHGCGGGRDVHRLKAAWRSRGNGGLRDVREPTGRKRAARVRLQRSPDSLENPGNLRIPPSLRARSSGRNGASQRNEGVRED